MPLIIKTVMATFIRDCCFPGMVLRVSQEPSCLILTATLCSRSYYLSSLAEEDSGRYSARSPSCVMRGTGLGRVVRRKLEQGSGVTTSWQLQPHISGSGLRILFDKRVYQLDTSTSLTRYLLKFFPVLEVNSMHKVLSLKLTNE